MPNVQMIETIDAPLDRIAELVTTTLASLNWRVKFVNDKLRKAAAFENKIDQRDRLTWRFEFDTIISWKKADKGVEINVEVSEKNMQWTKDKCHERCEAILDSLQHEAHNSNNVDENSEASTKYGAARWATQKDILEAGYITDQPDSKRLVLGPAGNGKLICTSAADTEMHCLLRGPTGSGKTSRFIIEQEILRLDTSAIVTEATAGDEPPDVYTKTAGWKAKNGHRVYYFNPDDMSSIRFNPVDFATTVNAAQEMADLIVENTTLQKQFGGDPIWPTSERHLLTALLLWARGEDADLGTIRRLLRLGADGLGMALMQSRYQEARDEFMAFYRVSTEGFRNGVIAGLMSRLNLWVSPRIVALTEKTDFKVEDLANEKFTFYLAVPAHKERLKPLAVLLFNFLLKLSLSQDFKHGLHLTLDELMNFNRIPGLAEMLTIIRHRHYPVMIGIQSDQQLVKVYGREEASILSDMTGTRISLRPRDYLTAKNISQALGTKTVIERKTTSSGQILEKEFGRALMEPSDILTLDQTKAIVQTPSTPPILINCFSWKDFEYATHYPPPERRLLTVSEELTRICHDAAEKPNWQTVWENAKGKYQKKESDNGKPINRSRPQEERQEKARPVERNDEDEARREKRNQQKKDERDIPPPVI